MAIAVSPSGLAAIGYFYAKYLGSLKRGYELRAPSNLHWSMIRSYRNEGCHYCHFGTLGIGIGGREGVAGYGRTKLKLKPELRSLWRLERSEEAQVA